ncbi:LLM class flavin-dependent oxidoreductase [Streptomyces niveiscabiei]|uniref:LLM class flavin-dependent oxidoreductase n=1 Tax=Streptomyces niveiscabiei TaxID=164115 RepID=UPI0029AF221D|nr:LLM class flavin-dependent oxidoreductase [Streptomyces niveiscabiei]MDX3386235.1 LLM class flavin-dependent oxidoreductase [Streptomyces niveiscabiei]
MTTRLGVLFPSFYPGSGEPPDPARLTAAARAAEHAGFDGFWVPERVTGLLSDPLIALAHVAAVTGRIRLGTAVLTLPGRPPALLAKQLASLDRLSGGRLAPALGLGRADPGEQQAFGVRRSERAALFDEALPLIRAVWAREPVTHRGPSWAYEGLAVQPKPGGEGPPLWVGGAADSELRRAGRLGDGWLGSSTTTPRAAEHARRTVESAARAAGRTVADDAYGCVVPYRGRPGPLTPVQLAVLERMRAAGLVHDVDGFAPLVEALPARLRRLSDAGLTLFVLVPLSEPADWEAEVGMLTEVVGVRV